MEVRLLPPRLGWRVCSGSGSGSGCCIRSKQRVVLVEGQRRSGPTKKEDEIGREKKRDRERRREERQGRQGELSKGTPAEYE